MSFVYVLIPLLPLLATIIIALAGRRLGETSAKVGIVATGLSLGLSVAAFVELALRKEPLFIPLYEFLRSGSLVVDLGLYIDQLTVLMLLLVTGGSFVVHVYSSRYMIGDARYSRFFAVMGFFTFGMVTLVMSSNLLMMFICWEIMGICSYLLISHQADREAACKAATKAFLVNAMADVGLLFGIILTFATFETLDSRQILDLSSSMSGKTINLLGWAGFECNVQTITVIALFLFMGCLGKSAQVPFHVWLPNAMEAPTPVSALIHAATMVNAGPFLLVRFSPLFMLSPVAMTVIAIIGGTTALFAAVVSLTQTDIKKILAYSTISQIGFMIMTCGLGAFALAIFHMLAHGCLKGFLFLSTGNQLESTTAHGHDEFASGRSRRSWFLYLGALILACAPPFLIFSGPYESLWTVHNSNTARIAFWVIGLLTIFFTAIYLFRGVTSLFGRSPSAVVQPRFFSPFHLLGISSGAAGLIGILLALWSWFVPFLTPALGNPYPAVADVWQPTSLFPLLTLPLLSAFAGWALACLLHAKPRPFYVARSNWAKTIYVMFLNKFYVDEIYSVYIVRPAIQFSRWLWRVVDVRGIDRAVDESAHQSVALSRWLWQMIEVRVIDRTVEGTGGQGVLLARWLWEVIDVRRIENNAERIGRVADATGHKLQEVEPRTLQHHLLVLNIWLVVAIVFFYWLVL
ncbi:MAG: NADH-quinone oxidoreductase subunit L [Pirellulales bacterium]